MTASENKARMYFQVFSNLLNNRKIKIFEVHMISYFSDYKDSLSGTVCLQGTKFIAIFQKNICLSVYNNFVSVSLPEILFPLSDSKNC